jgi:predicted MFS family arabinose efflux permease
VTGTVIGGFTGRFVSGLIASRYGWQAPFLVLALLGLGAAVALWRWLPRERNFSHANRQPGAVLDHLRNPRLVATFSAGFCVLFSLLGTFTYITFYLAAEPFHFGPAALGSLFFVYLVGAIVTPWSGRAIDRYGQRLSMTASMALSSTGLLLTLYPATVAVIAGLAMCCTGVFAAQAASSTHIGRVTTHSKALAVGMYVMFYYAGGSAGAAIPGLFWNTGGWPACVALFILVQGITVAIAVQYWMPGIPLKNTTDNADKVLVSE